nr:hypothetical protein [Halogeometricum sp. CBA1124]
MIWEVFRQDKKGDYHEHCGNVHAPDREMALTFAQVQHARRKRRTASGSSRRTKSANSTPRTRRSAGRRTSPTGGR